MDNNNNIPDTINLNSFVYAFYKMHGKQFIIDNFIGIKNLYYETKYGNNEENAQCLQK